MAPPAPPRRSGDASSGGSPPAWANTVVAEIAEPIAASPAFAPGVPATPANNTITTTARHRKTHHPADNLTPVRNGIKKWPPGE